MNPQHLFLQDNHRDLTGWDAVCPTIRPSAPILSRIEQLWKERDDIVERAMERGEFTDADYFEMEMIEAGVELLERELETVEVERE